MGKIIIVQPNGKYAQFSSVVDCITWYEMTEDEVYGMHRDAAIEDSKYYARRAIESAKRKPDRWDEVIETMKTMGTFTHKTKMIEVVKECGE